MKSVIGRFIKSLWGDAVPLTGKIFNTLAMAGVVISLIMATTSLFSESTLSEAFINIGSAFFSLAMLILHLKTKNYHLCSVITITMIFLVVFPAMFFASDGYTGGMPSFFIFAIIFTIYLIRGRIMIVLVILQYIVFISICFYAYFYPDSIAYYRDDYNLMIDIIAGFVSVSLILGTTMFIQFRLYLKQQTQLEQARAEAERADKAKSAFLGNMSHEIRTPIGIILGTNELMSRDAHSKQLREQIAKIKSAGELLDALINNVLDFVKIEAEKTVLKPESYRLSTILNELEQYSRVLCKKKDLNFSFFATADLNDHLVGDALAIKQVLLNIINNAVKYTEKGSVTLIVEQRKSEIEGETMLCFTVSDTGIGIRQDEVDQIFDSFKRIDRRDGRYIEGVGLGLSIVKQLLGLMNGDIEVVSIYGRGSDFMVYIPQKVLLNAPKVQGATVNGTFVAPSVRLLIVDDNTENLLLFKALLERTAMQIDTAQTATQCIELVTKNRYDVLLMDYMMPDMNGIELLARLKDLADQKFDTPVIAITANAESGTKEHLLQNGFSDYLTKPVSWVTLEGSILSFIPKERYRIIEPIQSAVRDDRLNKVSSMSKKLEEFGIDCDIAFHYSGNNFDFFYKSTLIYLSHTEREMQSARELLKKGDLVNLQLLIHSLKSRAKNIGAHRLSLLASELEPICKEKNEAEFTARVPYLFFLWEESIKGYRLIEKMFSEKDRTKEVEVV